MFVKKKVERYVERAVRNMPLKYRGRAEREIRAEIYEAIDVLCGEREPDILEVREILKGIGRPEDKARSWLIKAKQEAGSKKRRLSTYGILELLSFDFISLEKMNALLQGILWVFTVLAVVLVVFGVVALSTHAISTMLPIFLGCVLALGVVAGRGVLNARLHF